jgi:folate-binding protein YgfZ
MNAATQFNLTELGLLKISGQGALNLLQGQLSLDMNELSDRNGLMGAHCNPQGRIISLFYAVKIDMDYYLLMPKSLIKIARDALNKYAPFYKCELKEDSEQYDVIGVTTADLSSKKPAAIIHVPLSERKIFIVQKGLHPDAETGNYDDWHLLDLLEGIPSLYPETSGKFLPHDLNLPALNAVSFTKGCFTGQEIIARMQYRGNPKKHLYRGMIQEQLAPGSELFADNTPCADIIDCSEKVYNDHHVILMVADDAAVSKQLRSQQGNLVKLG